MRKDMIIPNAMLSVLGPGLTSADVNQSDICLTPGCIKAAAHMLNNLHPDYESLDPCSDFNQYACGGFPTRWPEEEAIDTIEEVQRINKYTLKSILDNPYPKTDNPSKEDEQIFAMLTQNYAACMSNTSIEASGLGGIPEILDKISELFPIEGDSYDSQDNLSDKDFDAMADVIAYMSQIGVPVFGEFWTVADMQNPDVMVPQFTANLFTLMEHALPSKIAPKGLADIPEEDFKTMLEAVLGDEGKDAAEGLTKGLLELAAKIKEIEDNSEDAAEGLAAYYHTTTVKEAAEAAPALVIDKVLEKLVPKDYKLDRMNFVNPKTNADVSSLLLETPKPVIQSLLKVIAFSSYSEFVAGSTDPTETDRWPVCFDYVDQSLPWIASKFFLDVTSNDEKRHSVQTMAEELKTAFSKRIEKFDWVDDATKAKIQKKIERVGTLVSYPDHTPNARDPAALLEYYEGVNITDNLFSNALSIRKWANTRIWDTLSSPVDTAIWPEQNAHAYITGARFLQNANSMVIPNGISQAPIFFEDAPSYLMYSTIGLVSGHELTHGFDTNGRDFNQDRAYKTWWDDGSTKDFDDKKQCFTKQYNSMEVVDYTGAPLVNPETNKTTTVNGTLTLAENIADAGGIKNAYEAWKLHEEESPAQHLPGLDKFTKEQLFFLGFGQVWCSKWNMEKLAPYVLTNGHSPPNARINGVAANSRAFKEAFQCEKKEPVCELW